jgi:iron complex outermembrane receptor protein
MKQIKFLLLFFLSIRVAHAVVEDKKQNIILSKIIVQEQKSITANSTISAQQKVNTIAGSVAIIDKENFHNKASITMQDLFSTTAGVFAQSKQGQESKLSIRGSGLSRNFHLRGINLYQDNIPINLADGSADFQSIDPLAVNHIEIYKGANALHLGSASLGGAINFISPTGYNANKLIARVDGGSFDSNRIHISSGKVIGNSDYYVALSNFKSNGYRQQNQQLDNKLNSNYGYRFNKNLENRTYLSFINSQLELPGALTATQLNNNSKSANQANIINKQERNVNEIRFANKTSYLTKNISNNFSFFTVKKNLDHPIFQVVLQDSINYGLFADSKINYKLFNKESQLNLGINLGEGIVNSKRFTNIAGKKGNQTMKGNEKAQTAIFFIENNWHFLPKTTLTTGSQFLYRKLIYQDKFLSDGNQSGVRKYYGISPKIGAIYQVKENMQLYGNISGAYEPPTFTEARQTTLTGLANISAQKSYTTEIGLRKNNSNFNFDLTAYRSYLQDELIIYTIAPNITQTINAKKTIHQGLELATENILLKNIFDTDNLSLKNAYTFSDFCFINDATYKNNKIPGNPRHYLFSQLIYKHSNSFFISPSFEAVPQGIIIDAKNNNNSKSYFAFGLNTGFNINDNFSIFAEGRNLLNKNYAAAVDVLSQANNNNVSVYYPASPRAFYFGLKYKL